MNHWTFSISDVANGLDKVTWKNPRDFIACCPAHDDHNPSLSVSEVDGKILIHCFAGCSYDDVKSVLKARGNWPNHSRKNSSANKKLSRDSIWKYQMLLATEIARHNQGIPHSEEDIEQIEATVRFLKSQGYE